MADLESRGSYTPRRKREQRAYVLTLMGGGAALLAAATLVLAFLNVVGFGLPILLIVISIVCGFLFRRAVS